MNKLLIFILAMVAYGAWQHYNEPQPVSGTAGAHNRVIMYSLTTCGYCKQKARELNAAGIAFTEYFIDKDMARRDELSLKLEQSGLPRRSYGTPIMDVHGTMLPNNPSMEIIKSHLSKTL